VQRRKLNLKAKIESSSSFVVFQALRIRRFQCGFDRVNLHHLTLGGAAAMSMSITSCGTSADNQGLTLVPVSAHLEQGQDTFVS